MKPALLFITNPGNSDPKEDRFLSNALRDTFEVRVADPHEAVTLLPHYPRCLIRNAWPSRDFKDEFIEMRRLCVTHGIKSYNPFHRNNYVEDKSYLVELFRQGHPVIPTVDALEDLAQLPSSETYIIKPKDGCSSFGVQSLSRKKLLTKDLTDHIIQPEIDFVDEVSLYFIDDHFTYATVSAGKRRRWDLSEYQPTTEEIAWAQRFVDWNALPYGLQRIDGCRTKDGTVLLMEVESEMPMLTLADISDETRERFLAEFKASLLTHLQ